MSTNIESRLVIPPHLRASLAKQEAVATREVIDEEPSSRQLPTPTGYRILIAIPEADKTFDNGLIKADSTKQLEEVTTVVGFVLKMGGDCYKDTARFPSGPYCKEGDFVVMRAYSGTRFKIHGKEFRLINDDTVEAVVDDPRGLTRI